MSFRHPSARFNSAGQEADPLTPRRAAAARANLRAAAQRNSPLQPWRDLLSWERLGQDVFITRPLDDRPQDEQDMIRQRRRDAFANSSIPWVVTDATALLTFADDIDDLKKSAQFLKSYAFDPLRQLHDLGGPGLRDWWRSDKDAFKKLCDADGFPRTKKRVLAKGMRLDFLTFAALRALANLFPSWRFLSLALQFLQSTEMLFGVGLSLGPIMGAAIESAVRGAALLGAPFSPSTNKYNQILASRVLQRLDKGLPAAAAMHPDDALDAGAGALAASNPAIVPPIILDPSEYPDFGEILAGDTEQFGNLAATAAALPWNLGAFFVNDFLAPLLFNLSEILGGPGNDAAIPLTWRAASAQLQRLTDQGICPGPFCGAEVDVALAVATNDLDRFDVNDGHLLTQQELLRNLGWGRSGRQGPFFPAPPRP